MPNLCNNVLQPKTAGIESSLAYNTLVHEGEQSLRWGKYYNVNIINLQQIIIFTHLFKIFSFKRRIVMKSTKNTIIVQESTIDVVRGCFFFDHFYIKRKCLC